MKKRETELDILRICAMLAVISTHSCGFVADNTVSSIIMTF